MAPKENGKCVCDKSIQNINQIFVDDTETVFTCCTEGQVSQNGECTDQCGANYVKTGALCDCVNSSKIKKIPNPTEQDFVFNPFLCCNEGQVNQQGECKDQCDAGFQRNDEALCVRT